MNILLADLEIEKIEILFKAYDSITDSYKNGNEGVNILQKQLQIELGESTVNANLTIASICNKIISKAEKFVPLNKIVFKHRNRLDKDIWSNFIQTHLIPTSPTSSSDAANEIKSDSQVETAIKSENSYQIWPSENQESFPFLIILDEASVLTELTRPGQVNTLTIIRRALHFMPPTNSFLVVTLGTNCDISTLNKPVNDNSLRYESRPNLLFPLIVTGNWDIYAEESKLHELVVDGNLLRNHRTQLLSCSFGRPLWSSLFLQFMITTAIAKIKNGSTDLFTPMVAAWCIRVGLTVHADSKLSEKLLRSHMATLVAASSNSERVIINYSAEPILAIAAREFLKDKRDEYFKSLLKFVEGVPTDRGKIGESVFSEILLNAMDKSIKIETVSNLKPAGASETVIKILNTQKFLLEEVDNSSTANDANNLVVDTWCKDYHHVTNLENYLRALYSDYVFSKMKPFLPTNLLQGLVNFSQFISTHREFPYELFFEHEKGQNYGKSTDASGKYAKNAIYWTRRC